VFWVISLYFNIRNTLPNSGTFLLGKPVYIYIYVYIYIQGVPGGMCQTSEEYNDIMGVNNGSEKLTEKKHCVFW